MFVKCPKCDLNYMNDTEKMCKVCYKEIHGTDAPEEVELCSICNETPCMPGKDVCLFCHKELAGDGDQPDEEGDEPALTGDETVSTMDEIAPDIEDPDIPEPEYRDIDKDLSLEELEEKEEADSEEDDEDD